MEFQRVNDTDKLLSPLKTVKSVGKTSCGCTDSLNNTGTGAATPPYIVRHIATEVTSVPVVSTVLSSRDLWETFKSRVSSFRMNYTVKPGLYAAGSPDEKSDVFVTANYKMSFDALRSSLNGINAWILVLDTKGINVWCAAGKGTFGTDELVKRIMLSKITDIISHRKIIVPQLGAPGVNPNEVTKRSGFKVMYGPVRAADLKKYISNGYTCDEEMRRVRFDIIDRLILTPIELRQILVKFPLFALVILLIFGLTPEGIIFKESIMKGYLFLAAGLISVFTGAFFTPVFLPFIPFRSFALKGWIAGMVFFVSVIYLTGGLDSYNIFMIISALILFPVFSSYMALQFTGASTYTNLSGVKKEIKIAFPVYITGALISFIFLILYKVSDWGFL